MSIKQPQVGGEEVLSILTGAWGSVHLHLFTNNVTPGDSDVLGTYTEVNGGVSTWYSAQAVASWSAPAAGVGSHASTTGSSVSWTHNGVGGSVNCYGYYATDGAGNLLFSERFASAPVVMATNGQVLTLTVTYTQASEF